MDLVIFFVLFV